MTSPLFEATKVSLRKDKKPKVLVAKVGDYELDLVVGYSYPDGSGARKVDLSSSEVKEWFSWTFERLFGSVKLKLDMNEEESAHYNKVTYPIDYLETKYGDEVVNNVADILKKVRDFNDDELQVMFREKGKGYSLGYDVIQLILRLRAMEHIQEFLEIEHLRLKKNIQLLLKEIPEDHPERNAVKELIEGL